jgi:hypothetical protein
MRQKAEEPQRGKPSVRLAQGKRDATAEVLHVHIHQHYPGQYVVGVRWVCVPARLVRE